MTKRFRITVVLFFFFLVLPFFLFFLFLLVKPAQAAVRCETQYGGEVCVKTGELQIDKEVWHPGKQEFWDNLYLTTYIFGSGEEITFRLKIKNVGDEKFDEVKVEDRLPSYVELVSGELSFTIKDLEPDETEEREIKVRVVSLDQLPESRICDVNTVEVWADDEHDKDTAQVCIEEKVLGVAELPPTGPKYGLIILLVSLINAIIGFYLIRKT